MDKEASRFVTASHGFFSKLFTPIARAKQLVERHERAVAKTAQDDVAKAKTEAAAAIVRATSEWHASVERLRADVGRLVGTSEPALASILDALASIDAKQQKQTLPPALRYGHLRREERGESFHVPLVVPANGSHGILIKCDPATRSTAIQIAQNLLLRLLAALPPGKVRFLFIDPIDLGRSVSRLLPLGDYDDRLISSKVWTMENQIEARLVDVREHMENVIQKYLRNEYERIDQFNLQAGALSEPYRVILVNDFPHGFRAASDQNLASIVRNGPTCGVLPILIWNDAEALRTSTSFDPDMHFHDVVDLTKLRDAFPGWELEFDSQPGNEAIDDLISRIGPAARTAGKVEIAFSEIAPSSDSLWSRSTLDGISVPLGPKGVDRYRTFDLGRGTQQHALVAGKTGSGKSTLLHVLITNLMLHYSPDELQLYLMDFKKGIEFKPYATFEVPHARVVAIEGEQEFGVSVLEGLQQEVKRRGRLFQDAEAENLRSYREATKVSLPRIVVIVDEFQVLFEDEGPFAARASAALDDLVRQGRAFGVHVVLSSQTLRGIRNIKSSTVEQIGVRIALQCSEEDSRTILAADNPAARALTRPGEAIYNATNGTVEGNDPFQIAWLADGERESALRELQELATSLQGERSKTIVFDGRTVPKLPKTSQHYSRHAPAGAATIRLLVGEPVAIRDSTAAILRRESNANLLVVGRDASCAARVVQSALASFLLQEPHSGVRRLLVDLGRPSHERTTLFSALGELGLEIVDRHDLADVVMDYARLLEEREGSPTSTESHTPMVLTIFGIHRAQALAEPVSHRDSNPARDAFLRVVQEGPNHGLHTLAWTESVTALQSALGRNPENPFSVRIALQMNEDDSRRIVGSPIANRIGENRAVLFNIEEGWRETFRPYDAMTREELNEMRVAIGWEG